MDGDQIKKLKLLEEEVKTCIKCQLHSTRTQTVFSRGNPEALIGVCGRDPGKDEDEQGIPFVGKSGQLLNKAITELGYDIENDIYVFNPIKCRPPNNRQPEPEEINACLPYFEQQLDLISAKIIITLGGLSTTLITDKIEGITKLRGSVIECKGKLVIPSWHPSFILRNGGPNSKQYTQFKDDIKLAFDRAADIKEKENGLCSQNDQDL